jgi:hypothetical protein
MQSYGRNIDQILDVADMLSLGIMQQFSNWF